MKHERTFKPFWLQGLGVVGALLKLRCFYPPSSTHTARVDISPDREKGAQQIFRLKGLKPRKFFISNVVDSLLREGVVQQKTKQQLYLKDMEMVLAMPW